MALCQDSPVRCVYGKRGVGLRRAIRCQESGNEPVDVIEGCEWNTGPPCTVRWEQPSDGSGVVQH